MSERGISQVEVNPLKKEVSRHKRLQSFGVSDDGSIIAHTTAGALMLYGEVSGQALDERKFAERRDLCSLHIDIEYLG